MPEARRRSGTVRHGLPVLALAMAVAMPGGVAGQEAEGELTREILESQRRLEEVRNERIQLQREMDGLRTRVRDVSAELRNVERQLSASRSVLAELDFQAEATAARIEQTNADLETTRSRLQGGRGTLNDRLRFIYKQGPLHTARVLLGADSFANLLNRYRYLRLIAAYDRTLVERVQQLERALVIQNRELQQSLTELERVRRQKGDELTELRNVEATHTRTLTEFRSQEQRQTSRLAELDANEAHLSGLIDDLERSRTDGPDAAPSPTTPEGAGGTFADTPEGSLDWPVEGPLVYRFGREERPNGIVLRWNGVGIGAAPGAPVQAVKSGRVVLAGPFEGYGPTVVVHHGDGFYSLYLYLDEIGVVEGRDVEQGQVVGTVGGGHTPEGAHIEFQIRAPVEGRAPQAQDPLRWLKPRSDVP